jgi:hypothetical protein
MVETPYQINGGLSQAVQDDISALPNFMGITTFNAGFPTMYTVITFDHTPSQSTAFKKILLSKLGLYNDALAKYTNFNGGSLIYNTDTPVILTNIGTTYKNLYARSDGMSFGADTDVYEVVRVIVHWTKGGSDTGTQSLQIIDKQTPSNILATVTPLVTGVNVGSIVAIPAALLETQKLYLIQVKSTVATDDPVFEGIRVMMK